MNAEKKIEKQPHKQQKIEQKKVSVTLRMTEKEHRFIQEKMLNVAEKNKSNFLRKAILNCDFKVVTTDSSLHKVIVYLTKTHEEIRKIGVNYNQVTKHINVCFGEQKAVSLLQNLEVETQKLNAWAEKTKLIAQELQRRYGSEHQPQ